MANLNTIAGLHYEIIKRCYNENSVAYKDYGAKGIKVCKEWHDRTQFRKWCYENGWKKGLRINRIDATKDYCPENCILGNKNCLNNGAGSNARKIKNYRGKMKKNFNVPKCYSHLRIYRIFVGMHSRCELKTNTHYMTYGGRGISVCSEWSGKYGFFHFYNWAMDNGYSEHLTLDRINPNGNYEPQNCRWATTKEQLNNRRCSLNYNYNNSTYSLSEICKIENLKYGLVYSRLKKGLSLEDAILDVKSKQN